MKLELRGITKRFGSLVANDHIDLVVKPGEIHALLGENGAGKSTLMNVLYGLYQADDGEILLDDEVQHFAGPGDAMNAGTATTFDTTTYIGDLSNDGVGIASFHDFASKVPSTLQSELDTIKAGIISGSIPVKSYLAP